MKKILTILLLSLVMMLTGCDFGSKTLDYSDFKDHAVNTYGELEAKKDARYIAYYYSETCTHCAEIKEDVLSFFSGLEGFDFYLLDIANAPDSSGYEEFLGTPTLFVIQDGVILERYIGSDFVEQFLVKYADFDINNLEYSYFNEQHLYTYGEALNIESEAYILYYYLEDCPHCINTKPDFLKWAWERGFDEIYFMNGAYVTDPDNIPTELIVLNSGTPILVIMTNGEFANEYYSGTEEVLEYIETIGTNPITIDHYTK